MKKIEMNKNLNDSFYKENITLGLQNQSTYAYGDAYCFAMSSW